MGLFDKVISKTLPLVPKPIIGYFSQRYIAGERLDDAVLVIKRLMQENACATLDVLGESVQHIEQAGHAVEIYKQVLQRIHEEQLDANISIKPSHMGIKIDKEACYQNIRSLVEMAKSYKNFVRIDMEDHTTTSDTLEIYGRLKQEFNNVGAVLQAYMRRTQSDIDKALPLNPNFRLCKGIYIEPRAIAYKDPSIINRNFTYSLEKLLLAKAYVGIATHDERIVWEAMHLIDRYRIPRDKYEFQMLLGVDPQLRKMIVKSGHKLRVYIPFGAEWYQYSIRRLQENPQIAIYVLQSIVNRLLGRDK